MTDQLNIVFVSWFTLHREQVALHREQVALHREQVVLVFTV